ncbi:hypothetical protein J3Q64DRAFT_1734385 [Phycomyces blakesleeanus]|uniref:EamA domain-containing protein n=1 Tax=Phycomyces blakesleeanus TaxID=4837 RepID=A0ABR3B208_PHYBL
MRQETVQEQYRAESTTHAPDTLQMHHLDSLTTLTSQTSPDVPAVPAVLEGPEGPEGPDDLEAPGNQSGERRLELGLGEEHVDVPESEDSDDQDSIVDVQPPRRKTKPNFLQKLPIFSVLSLICAGCALAIQSACNATLTRYGTRSFTSVFSFGSGLILCTIFFLVDIFILKRPLPNIRKAKGAYYVIINILTVPRLGAATVLAIFVGSQVIVACIVDHFGLVGMKKRPFTIPRIIASLGLVGCVVVIAMF